jgi:hypothetical protein
MRNYPDCNFPAFDRAAGELTAAGFNVINPAEMDRVYEGWGLAPPVGYSPTYQDRVRFIRRDLLAISELDPAQGDAIYLLVGWEGSAGARTEQALAEFLGLTMMEEG